MKELGSTHASMRSQRYVWTNAASSSSSWNGSQPAIAGTLSASGMPTAGLLPSACGQELNNIGYNKYSIRGRKDRDAPNDLDKG